MATVYLGNNHLPVSCIYIGDFNLSPSYPLLSLPLPLKTFFPISSHMFISAYEIHTHTEFNWVSCMNTVEGYLLVHSLLFCLFVLLCLFFETGFGFLFWGLFGLVLIFVLFCFFFLQATETFSLNILLGWQEDRAECSGLGGDTNQSGHVLKSLRIFRSSGTTWCGYFSSPGKVFSENCFLW